MNPVIEQAIAMGADVSISISGGKDSQAMMNYVVPLVPDNAVHFVHADLGRAEWPQTPAFVDKLVADTDDPLIVVRRTKGDLVQRIEERLTQVSTLTGEPPAKPFWPSSAQRYCTSDLKRDPIHKHQRSLGKGNLIVSCVGMRSEESPRRAKMPTVAVEKRITCKQLRNLSPQDALNQWDGTGRLVLLWLPLHDWLVGRVWEEIGTTETELHRRQALYQAGKAKAAVKDWPAHVAYVYGNERLSCALCVLACKGDLQNGKKHHPELYERYVQLEQQSGFTFKNGQALGDL